MKKDLARGEDGENLVIDLLKKAGIDAEKDNTVCTRSHHDIRAHGRFGVPDEYADAIVDFTLEVKNDIYAARTGNIAIEVYNPKSNKLSGISVTKADIWVQIAFNQIWFADTKEIILFMGQNQPKRIVNAAGDGNADIWLYEADRILPSIFIRMDNLSKNEIHDSILKLLNGV